MDFAFTTEQDEFRRTVRSFAESVIAPRAQQMDETGEFPVDIVREMGAWKLAGCLRVTIGTMPENRRFIRELERGLRPAPRSSNSRRHP
jgi:histidinol-phosphate/aromatic aminotransferase/cobyric acid decarboxylase-like protein